MSLSHDVDCFSPCAILPGSFSSALSSQKRLKTSSKTPPVQGSRKSRLKSEQVYHLSLAGCASCSRLCFRSATWHLKVLRPHYIILWILHSMNSIIMRVRLELFLPTSIAITFKSLPEFCFVQLQGLDGGVIYDSLSFSLFRNSLVRLGRVLLLTNFCCDPLK